MFQPVIRDLPALAEGLLAVLPDLHDGGRPVHPDAALKVQIQRPVVEVDAADRRDFVIRYDSLGMDEARCIFIDPDTGLNQLPVTGTRQEIGDPLVRNPRRHNPDIDTRLRRKRQRRHHFIVNNQVRRVDPDIVVCLRDNVQINILTDRLIVERRITVRLYIAIVLKLLLVVQPGAERRPLLHQTVPAARKPHQILQLPIGFCDNAPHLQKHHGE